MGLANLRMSAKTSVTIAFLVLLTALATGISAQAKFASDLEAFAKAKLMALKASRQSALEQYLASIRQDLTLLASSDVVRSAMVEFDAAWRELGDAPEQTVQRLYISDNPNPPDARARLDDAGDGSRYSRQHAHVHPWFRSFLEQRGYYDLFLFSRDGDLIYTVVKERDLGTNFIEGPWAGSNLGKVFRAVNDKPAPGVEAFRDFERYEPSLGAPASFIATSVFDRAGSYLGVLAFQMPIDRINDVMRVSAGMGETGESYLVGEDLTMRTDSLFVESSTMLSERVDTPTVRSALAGESGVEAIAGYRGTKVLSAYGPLSFLGVRWAILADIGYDEMLAPIGEGIRFMLFAVGIVLLIGIVIALALARGISQPIVQMTRSMRQLAAGDLGVDVPAASRQDEIGEMAEAMAVFKENARKRRLAEQEAEKRSAQLRAVLDQIPAGVYLTNPNLEVEVVNDQLIKLFGFPDGFVKEGIHVSEMIRWLAERGNYPGEDVESAVDKRINALKSGSLTISEQTPPTGRNVQLTHVATAEGGVCAVISDVTDRRRAELALQESRDTFQALADNLPEFITMKDTDGRFVFVNKQFEEWTQKSREHVIGKTVFDIYDDAQANAFHTLDQQVLTSRRMLSDEVDLGYPDGNTRTVLRMRFPVVASDGNLLGLGTVNHDISERKRDEDRVRAAKLEVERALEELKTAQQNLIQSEKMASLGQLTAGIAHEIKNPLNFVNNFSETSVSLLEELDEVLEPVKGSLDETGRDDLEDVVETLKGDLQKIHHHGKRADSIVKSMLLHARGDTSARVPTALNALVEEAYKLAYHGERARDKSFNATLESHFDETTGDVELVPEEITRVLVNMFSNAFYAMKKRAESSDSTDYAPTVTVTTNNNDSNVEIRIRDNGEGMPDAVREKLFDPFFTTKPTGEGTGLGLSMSFDIVVQQHGGRIDVSSEPGSFTEFAIRLPRRRKVTQASAN